MLKIVVVDISAEARSRMLRELQDSLDEAVSQSELLPGFSLRPLSPEELKYSACPDVCIVGEELIQRDLAELASIRQTVQGAALLARIPERAATLAIVEHAIRLGADDVIDPSISAIELIRRIVVLRRRLGQQRAGKLILVDGAKGGVGTTTVAAGMGEALALTGKRVALLDLDADTQDLSRFLQARPFINENLQLLLDKQRSVSDDAVRQCLVRVWLDSELYCMPPVAESERFYETGSIWTRIMLSILELLDHEFDTVIVDAGPSRGSLLQALHHAADKIVVVVNNDPATLYAALERVRRIRAENPVATIVATGNSYSAHGLSNSFLKSEFLRASGLGEQSWCGSEVPHCRNASRWPASGGTIYSLGARPVSKAIENLLCELDLLAPSTAAEQVTLRERALEVLSLIWRRGPDGGKPAVRTLPAAARTKLPGAAAHPGLPSPEQLLSAVTYE